MLTHRSAGRRPQLTFTADFHELVQGDFLPGPCAMRYDPWRIVPRSEVLSLPASQRPVQAHINFHPMGGFWEGELRLRPGTAIEPIPDPTGQGTMLRAEFLLPAGCEELECWFSYVDAAGQTHWDSAMGANFWLRFPTHDLTLLRGEVVKLQGEGVDRLEVELESIAAVEIIDLRWRLTQPAEQQRRQCALVSSAARDTRKGWTTPVGGVPVPSGATVVFDLVYTAGGHTYTDDNEGTWFLAE
jgi:hypothetical protein